MMDSYLHINLDEDIILVYMMYSLIQPNMYSNCWDISSITVMIKIYNIRQYNLNYMIVLIYHRNNLLGILQYKINKNTFCASVF